jgi:hypothetical protein
MKLPDFCSEGWRTHALLLTYTLDPFFFETVVRRRLEMGGAHRILVLADAGEALPRVAEAASELRYIGRSWALGPVRMGGSFHPKLIARFGGGDASVAVLSGNLTPSGWGRNLEVGANWLVGPGHEDGGGWLAALLASASSWSTGAAQQAILDEIRALPWLRTAADLPATKRPVLASGDATLFQEIRRRWAGRRFERALIATGSTDADGAFVRQLVDTFGLAAVEVYVNADHLSFVGHQVDGIPLSLWSPPSNRTLHAKIVWLRGPEGDVAAWGSANCSRSAWLLPANRGGNVELMVLDDAPDTENLNALFGTLREGERIEPLPAVPASVDDAESSGYPVELVEAEVRVPGRWVVRATSPTGTVMESPVLRVAIGGKNRREFALSPGPAGTLVGLDEMPGQHLPLFARLRCTLGGVEVETQPIPVNQPDRLLRAHLDPETARRLAGITPDKTSFTDREAVLQDLFELAWSEFRETPPPADGHPKHRREDEERDDQAEAPPLDPLDLVYKASAGASPLPLTSHHGSGSSGYLSCFERLMWGSPSPGRDLADAESVIPPEGDGQGVPFLDGVPTQSLPERGTSDDTDQGAEDSATAASLRSRLSEWIHKLGGDTVLKQPDPPATAFRCAVFVIGLSQAARRARWISTRDATDFAVRTIGCFLRRGRTPGLLADLRAHHSEGPLAQSFRTHIGSGRLLSAFVNALTADEPEDISDALERGSALARLRSESALVAQLDQDGLAGLCGGAPDAQDLLMRLSRGSAIAAASEELDIAMRQQAAALGHRIGRGTQLRPDIFWSGAEGWVPDRATSTIMTPCIGWRTACRDPLVRGKADAVMHAWSGSDRGGDGDPDHDDSLPTGQPVQRSALCLRTASLMLEA